VSPIFVSGGDGLDTVIINTYDNNGLFGMECGKGYCAGVSTDGTSRVSWFDIESVELNGGTGDDDITVIASSYGTSLFVDLGTGSDTYTIKASGNGIGMTSFVGPVAFSDDTEAGGRNNLIIDATACTTSNIGAVDIDTITWSDMSIGIHHYGIQSIDVKLGCGGLTNCRSSIQMIGVLDGVIVSVAMGLGNDNQVTLGGGPTGIDALRGSVDVSGAVIPTSCAGHLFIDHSNGQAVTSGSYSNAKILGIGSIPITFSAICDINIRLSDHADTFIINVTHAYQTNINLGAGNDALAIVAVNGPTNITGGAGADFVLFQPSLGYNRIRSPVYIDGDTGIDTVNISYTGIGASSIYIDDTSLLRQDVIHIMATPNDDRIDINQGRVALINKLADNVFETVVVLPSISIVNVYGGYGNDNLTMNGWHQFGRLQLYTNDGMNVLTIYDDDHHGHGLASFDGSSVVINGGTPTANHLYLIATSISSITSFIMTNHSFGGYGTALNTFEYTNINEVTIKMACRSAIECGTTTNIQSLLVSTSVVVHMLNVTVPSKADNVVIIGSSISGTNYVNGAITVHGGISLHDCYGRVIINDKNGDVIANGHLEKTLVTGVTHHNVIYYHVCQLAIHLSSFNDYFTIHDTHIWLTNITSEDGDDTVIINTINGETNVWTNNDNDYIGHHNGSFNQIHANLFLDGGHGSDIYNITLSGSGDSNITVDDSSDPALDRDQLFIYVINHFHFILLLFMFQIVCCGYNRDHQKAMYYYSVPIQ
jgi:hypothetical protein